MRPKCRVEISLGAWRLPGEIEEASPSSIEAFYRTLYHALGSGPPSKSRAKESRIIRDFVENLKLSGGMKEMSGCVGYWLSLSLQMMGSFDRDI